MCRTSAVDKFLKERLQAWKMMKLVQQGWNLADKAAEMFIKASVVEDGSISGRAAACFNHAALSPLELVNQALCCFPVPFPAGSECLA